MKEHSFKRLVVVKKTLYNILFLSFFIYSDPILAECQTISSKAFEKLIHKKSPVFLVFFSSWCSDCKDELLGLKKKERMEKNYILVNTFDSPGKGEKVLKNLGINYLCIYDKNRELAKKYRIDFVPKSLLVQEKLNR